jgi:probable addiction module antidote protein
MADEKPVTHPWDPAEHLETDDDIAAYLDAALEDGDPALIAAVLGDIARARGMTDPPFPYTAA